MPETAVSRPYYSRITIRNPLVPSTNGDIALFFEPDYIEIVNKDGVDSFTSVEDAAAYARQELKKHSSSDIYMDFSLDWDNMTPAETQEFVNTVCSQLMEKALRHDPQDPTGGDYILYHLSGETVCFVIKLGTFCRVVIHVENYLSDAAQEEQAAKAAEDIIKSLKLTGKTEYKKIKAIYGWLCDNVEYDYKNLNDSTYLLKHSAYAALVDKTAVCQGYATAFYRLALMAGLDARVVTGTGNGGPHGWNIVKLDGQWYYVDSTWDAGNSADEWGYFLRASLEDHTLDENSEAVVAQYDISTADYVPTVQKGSGNLNNDGDVDITDMQLLYQYLTTDTVPHDQTTLSLDAFLQNANVNGDDDVDVYDLQTLYEIVNKIR